MALTRKEKTDLIESTHAGLSQASSLVLAHYKGLTVAEISDLRGKVRAAGATFKVTQNRLTKRALEGTPFSAIADLFVGPTAIAYSSDPVAAAKALADFAKTNEKLVLVGGAFGDRKLDAKAVQELAKMPSLDELRGKIVGLLKAPAQRIAVVLAAPAGQVARVINAHATKGQ